MRQEVNKSYEFRCGHSCMLPARGMHIPEAIWHKSVGRRGHWQCRICAVAVYRTKKYGINTDDVNAKLVEQNGCAICHTWQPGVKGWHIDHNHTTMKTRGILCHQCNVGLGNFADDMNAIESALHYLQSHNGLIARTNQRRASPAIW